MDTHALKDALRRELSHPSSQMIFDQARNRTPLLQDHSTPLSVLAVLHDVDGDWREKDALTRVLIQQQQHQPDQLWTALLVAAYLPMLTRLRRRVRKGGLPSEDLDQLVLYDFLLTVVDFPLQRCPHHTCIRLRQRTARGFFRTMAAEKRLSALFIEDDVADLTVEPLPPWSLVRPRSRRDLDTDERLELAAMLRERIGEVIEVDKLDLVIATVLLQEDLRAYVARTRAELSPDNTAREYERLKRQRSRTLARVREILEDDDCPRSEPSGL
jgi:hypothetical protein